MPAIHFAEVNSSRRKARAWCHVPDIFGRVLVTNDVRAVTCARCRRFLHLDHEGNFISALPNSQERHSGHKGLDKTTGQQR